MNGWACLATVVGILAALEFYDNGVSRIIAVWRFKEPPDDTEDEDQQD